MWWSKISHTDVIECYIGHVPHALLAMCKLIMHTFVLYWYIIYYILIMHIEYTLCLVPLMALSPPLVHRRMCVSYM